MMGRSGRPAAFAGPETGNFGAFGRGMEADILRLRLSRRAGGAAVNAGTRHRIGKRAVHTGVSGKHRLPARIVRSKGGVAAHAVFYPAAGRTRIPILAPERGSDRVTPVRGMRGAAGAVKLAGILQAPFFQD